MRAALISLFMVFVVSAHAVPFTLHNSSLEAIPLSIPGVMNPKLSPLSDSGVDLAEGQEIFFYYQSKKKLLLTVTAKLAGQKLDVPKLIAEREAELKAPSEKKKKG